MSLLQRNLFGLCGLALVVFGAIGSMTQADSSFPSICLRAGLVILAIWLALPQLSGRNASVSGLFVAGIIVLIVVFSSRPRALFFALALAVAAFVLQTVGRRLISALTKPSDRTPPQ